MSIVIGIWFLWFINILLFVCASIHNILVRTNYTLFCQIDTWGQFAKQIWHRILCNFSWIFLLLQSLPNSAKMYMIIFKMKKQYHWIKFNITFFIFSLSFRNYSLIPTLCLGPTFISLWKELLSVFCVHVCVNLKYFPERLDLNITQQTVSCTLLRS